MSLDEDNLDVRFVGVEVASDEGDDQEDEDEDEDEEEPETASAEPGSAELSSGIYGADEVNDAVFEELVLPAGLPEEVQRVWSRFLSSAESQEAAGEAIYGALFDAAPSLQGLFKTPRAVMAMRFTNGLNHIISSLHDPKELKLIVETLGFQHLDLEVTVPRVAVFRDAIVELVSVEMGDLFSVQVLRGFRTFLNYVGGSYIYIRTKFAERVKVLASSWALATNKAVDVPEGRSEEAAGAEAPDGERASGDAVVQMEPDKKNDATKAKSRGKSWGIKLGSARSSKNSTRGAEGSRGHDGGDATDFRNTCIPKTFDDMFLFNAAVMGMNGRTWMNEILASFDAIVTNVANSYRLSEECDVLSLRIAKYKGSVNLSEFKSVMLASLRSLCKDWDSAHEVAWSWLWSNVERLIKSSLGKPKAQEAALARFLKGLDESAHVVIRRELYAKFFAQAPKGQDFFKQSTTRLHFIADKLVAMTLDMYKNPKKMVEEISAIGLRHVGYGIPTELFGPFVTACVQVVRSLTDDDAAEEAFRWSLGLISRICVRVVAEGSTIVMRAINANSAKLLKRAVSCAPRGKRALWMLNVQVGTKSISPFIWAIETGGFDAAKAIIVDLLTIRSDRDCYYYGMDILFERHPDVIKQLCVNAPSLLPTLLDGLVWRSRTTEHGQRRVNYFVKHLIVDADGQFSKAIEWTTDNQDAKLVCHPVVVLVTDMVWNKVAFRSFLIGKAWFLFTLLVFTLSQCVLNNTERDDEGALSQNVLIISVLCRVFIYLFSGGQQVKLHVLETFKAIRAKDFIWYNCVPMPTYLSLWQHAASLALIVVLILMLGFEPLLNCLGSHPGRIISEHCERGDRLLFPYSLMSSAAVLLYFMLLTDLSVFSTKVSAYVLVCARVLSELALSLSGLFFFIVAFACAISALEQGDPNFDGIGQSMLQLCKMCLGMFSGESFVELETFPALMFFVVIFMIVTVVFILNLLIAQLTCAYQATYLDMVGYARLNRGKIITDTMPSVSAERWESFVENLRLDDPMEFGEGDLGLPGGVQVLEPACVNITTVDVIRRFGGSTSPAAEWPQEDVRGRDDEDKFERLEKTIGKAMKRMSKASRAHGSGAGSSMGGSTGSSGGSGSVCASGGGSD